MLMEDSWENWNLHTEMDCDDYFFKNCHNEDDEFIREILSLHPPSFSSESESDNSLHPSSTVQNNSLNVIDGGVGLEQQRHGSLVKSDSSNSIVSAQLGLKRPRRSSSPKAYILSFDNSTMIPATPEPCFNHDQSLGNKGRHCSDSPLPSKRTLETQTPDPKAGPNQPTKKSRTTSQTIDHIMAERKRRQELTERFIALSATIPGLSKTDKASVLRAAIDYVKQLQERVQELEKQDKKKGAETVIVIKKPDLCGNEDTTSSETTSDHCSILPEIEARILGKDVLIEIHCEKENGIELKILDHLENLQLCVNGSSVLPFGNSALSITVIAQMGEEYEMTVNDLVKSLKQVLLKSQMVSDSDPY